MRHRFPTTILLAVSITTASAQIASHVPTTVAKTAPASTTSVQVSEKPVARVNGTVLTDRDLLREMYAIFPYAQQHNGFPKGQEAAIRQGALEMIIFEELVYQEAVRRNLTVPAENLRRNESEFRKQFPSPDQYQEYLKSEMQGSEQKLRQQIRRSLLIEQVLKTDVEAKSSVTMGEVRAYYEKNSTRFQQAETFSFQTISVVPPLKPTADQAREAQRKANGSLKEAKATKNYQEFGLLAEKISEDDFRVNMGDHKAVSREKLPPQVVKALLSMQPGQVSGLIQIETAYTIVRLNSHTLGRRQPLTEIQNDLKVELQKLKYERLRSGLAKQLRSKAKIEIG
jgi:parvulin-like peptidyl-prolyl isomerase